MNKTPAPGFTLVEAVTVLALVSLTLVLAVPVFQAMRERWATAGAMHGLSASLARARLTAFVEGVPVTVCPSADGLNCRQDLVWETGWMVYRDPGREAHPASAADVLWWEAHSPSVLAIRGSTGRHRVRFQPTGFAGGNNASLRICLRRGPFLVASVVVNIAGRARRERAEPGDEQPCPYAP